MRFDTIEAPDVLAAELEREADAIYRRISRSDDDERVQELLYSAARQIRALMDEVDSCHPE